MEISIRRFSEQDSVDDLTELIRSAYRRLADMGLRFVGTWQDAELTKKRLEAGECYVAVVGGVVVGTITLYLPESHPECAHYDLPGVAYFGQFAVDPALQEKGIGGTLLDFVEQRAAEVGSLELALDTAESAHHLIAYYEKRGYRFVQYIQWDSTNYRSVVMSKPLAKL